MKQYKLVGIIHLSEERTRRLASAPKVKISREELDIVIPERSLPYNFDYHLTHYLFYPWIVEEKSLVRLFCLASGRYALVKVSYQSNGRPALTLNIFSKPKLSGKDIDRIKKIITWTYGVNEEVKHFYEKICKKDPVLKAASKSIYGAHIRKDPSVFESVIGVVVAQNVYFKRIYKMLENLCKKFGEKQLFFGKAYYTFPNTESLSGATTSQLRSCGVGYRDEYIKGIAEKLVKEKINLDNYRKLKDQEKIKQKLMELPGVGPYTADLVIAISFDLPSFHLDLFTREVLYTFYFNGKVVPDKKLVDFVEQRWGRWKHYAMLALTSNTDEWAKKLGVDFRLKSAAQNK